MAKLNYDRTSVVNRGYIGKRGYKPVGVVIHNDAGSGTAHTYKNQLVNATLARLENGIAHSYISGNDVWQALPESYIAWHTANANGNKNYYGIEVCQSMSASDEQFLKNEQSAFKEAARLLKKWGLPVNRNTVKLHNMFSSTQCPHRSLAIHAGWTSTQMASDSAKAKVQDYFISQIKKYYDGKGGTESKPPKGWSVNDYGTYYKKVKNQPFTVGSEQIETRIGSPFLSAPSGGHVKPKQKMTFDYLAQQDGYEWGQLENNKGQQEFVPIRPLSQKEYWSESGELK